MGGIHQINSAYNIDSKKVHKKLSFTVGDQITARIVNLDKLTSEAVLKLLDGWQFSAQFKEPIVSTPEGLIKFQVEGYENGKLIIKMLSGSGEEGKESIISNTLEEQGINIKQEDYSIIEKMIKYKMALTKENISKIKSLIDFQGKILQDSKEEESFILKYLGNKGIDINSEKGQSISNSLKGFFKEFKNLSVDELMTFIENDIQFTEENIKSFNKLNKESMSLYKDIKGLEGELTKGGSESITSKEIQTEVKTANEIKAINAYDALKGDCNGDNKINIPSKNSAYIQNAYETNEIKELDKKEILKRLLNLGDTDNSDIEDGVINNIGKNTQQDDGVSDSAKGDQKPILNPESEVSSEEKLLNNTAAKEIQVEKLVSERLETSQKVKEQIGSKINEIQEIIKQALDENNSSNDVANKVLQGLQSKMNDFKMFNSISNQYYYLDVPVSLKDKEYPCKLIIKDDRKKGKKIDSTNVKFVASVRTLNMGVVDAYIKVSNSNINIDIKSEEAWVKVIDIGKRKLEKTLSNMGFIINVKVDKKEKEADLVKCRDFFEDNEFTRINLRV